MSTRILNKEHLIADVILTMEEQIKISIIKNTVLALPFKKVLTDNFNREYFVHRILEMPKGGTEHCINAYEQA